MRKLLLSLLCLAAFTCAAQSPPCVAIDADKLHSPIVQALRLWGQKSKLWPQNSILRVRFMDGTSSQRRKAWLRFQKIDSLVNLSFVQVGGESEIRVSFGPRGHYSYLGRDALTIGQRTATMNIQLSAFDGDREWDRVVLHEVCHAVGVDHEQAHPSANIPWNKPVVYADYARSQGWSRAQVDRQVLQRYSGNDFIGSAYDKGSIMQYEVLKRHLLDPRFAVGPNWRLSVTDIATLRRVYP